MESSIDQCFGACKMAAERCKAKQTGGMESYTMPLAAAITAVLRPARSSAASGWRRPQQ
jgi:hypothetical protein